MKLSMILFFAIYDTFFAACVPVVYLSVAQGRDHSSLSCKWKKKTSEYLLFQGLKESFLIRVVVLQTNLNNQQLEKKVGCHSNIIRYA